MNPARAFGPALAAQQWAYQPVYWIGPLAGGVAAAALYDLLFRRTVHCAAGLPHT
jgi:glycerol uptake facilitator-like aquaporin